MLYFSQLKPLPSIFTVSVLIGERSDPSVGRRTENFVLPCMPACGIYIYVPYFDNLASTWKILWTQLFFFNRKWSSWKIRNSSLDSSITKKTAAGLKAKGKNPGPTCGLLG